MLNCNEVTIFLRRPGFRCEQTLPRLMLSDSKVRSTLRDEVCFAKPDLFVIGASQSDDFQRQLDAAVVAAHLDPSNLAEGVVIASVPLLIF